MINKKLLFLGVFSIILIILITNVNAATIYGNVYGPDLSLLKNTLITINSTPIQNYVAINGNYSFNLPLGVYEINSVYRNKDITLKSKDTLNIDEEGEFIYDLILFDIEEVEDIGFDDKELIDQTVDDSTNFLDNKTTQTLFFIFSLIVTLIIITLSIFIFKLIKQNKKNKRLNNKTKKIVYKKKKDLFLESEKISSDETLNKIYSIIKKEKRINQKDIRKQMGISEAKISLAITDLEARGLVKRIKVGRGNVVLLKEIN